MATVFSTDEENYRFSTAHEAVEDIINGSFGDVSVGSVLSFRQGESQDVNIHPQAKWLIEIVQERAYEEVGEFAESFLDDATSEQVAELQSGLNSLIDNWLEAHGFGPNFYSVTDTKEIKARITVLTDDDFEFEIVDGD